MDVERIRQVLRDLPNQVDEAAEQLKAVAGQVERQLETLGPLLENLTKNAGGSPWDFSKFKQEAPQPPLSREAKTQWLCDNLDQTAREDLESLPDELFNEVYSFWKEKLG